jgi:hypothetical protein
VQYIRTGNADSNAAMLNINHQMGFKPYLSEKVWQVEIETVLERLEVDMDSGSEEWWLDWSALPDRFWARLTVHNDGHAEVLDLDGNVHLFASRQEAENWLSEDEYAPMDGLIEDGQLPAATVPPTAPSDAKLVMKMVEYLDEENS